MIDCKSQIKINISDKLPVDPLEQPADPKLRTQVFVHKRILAKFNPLSLQPVYLVVQLALIRAVLYLVIFLTKGVDPLLQLRDFMHFCPYFLVALVFLAFPDCLDQPF